ncbi:MAG TPA: beta-ketoacyl-ACP synthase II, partial [Thermoleophilia bacterium]|nr:beta-ketoacyl-ACP synthase II [Thermoleophilia bacterium]
MTDKTRRVVVTGMGVVSPLGADIDRVWSRLIAGQSGVGLIRNFDASSLPVRIAAEVRDFDALEYMDRRTQRRMDPFAQYALAAAIIAHEHSKLDVGKEPERVGALVASGVGGLGTFEDQLHTLWTKGNDRMSPLFIPMMIPNMAAAQISLALGTKGPLSTVCTACAASTNAIGDAFEIIRRGEAEVMFAGGSEAPVNNVGVTAFAAMRALSTRNDEPEKASRPFDRGRDGFVMGEGAGIIVLEEREHAERRGATIHAELVGYGMSSDSFHLTLPDETGQSQARAMRMAIDEAGIDPSEIDYINAHGTSTPPGDVAETRVIKLALGEDNARAVAISSTKSMIGHVLGGSGALEAVFSVLTIDRGVIPPTINLTEP